MNAPFVPPAPVMTPREALTALLEGNRRYHEDRPRHPHQHRAHRAELATGQRPFAVVVGCSDSRVPPEIVFDGGLGDLFVVRSAGHIVNAALIGSVEFAVGAFGVPLVLVLGHERCGAVQAAVDGMTCGGVAPGHIESVLAGIRPAVERVLDSPGDAVDNAVQAHVALVVEQLRTAEPLLAERVRHGALHVIGALYGLEDGVVRVLDV